MQEPEQIAKMLHTLTEPEVQARLQERQRKLQDDMTTSIGQVAKALRRTVPQLRNWEKQKALVPERAPANGQGGQRRYSRSDLRKLVIIEELLRRSYTLSDIATFMAKGYAHLQDNITQGSSAPAEAAQSLTERTDQAEQGYFWRFFVPQVLYLVISLVFEAPPAGEVGLFLPIYEAAQPEVTPTLTHAGEMARLGRTLLGWQGRDGRPFYTALYEQGASVEYPNLYSLIPLDELTPLSPATGAYLVADHKIAGALKTPGRLEQRSTELALKTAQRLLRLVQEISAEWVPLLRSGAGYMVYHAPDFTAPTLFGDPLLTKMAEMVVRAGGMKPDGKTPRWRFACILLPNNPDAPVYQWNLVVQAQSDKSPHQTGVTTLRPELQTPISLSQRALHSGHIVSRSEISSEDVAIVSRKSEEPIRSALALPIEGEGRSLGVLYIVSDEPAAFSEDDQRVLRVLGKMIGEVVLTYHARRLPADLLRGIIENPQIVEQTLREYLSENDFIDQLEQLLARIRAGEKPLEYLSFIALDIDRHGRVAHTYGEWAAKNLVLELGNETRELFRVHSRKPGDLLLYRVYADRFYILMNNFSLDATRAFATRLKRSLTHPYLIKAAHSSQDERDTKITLDVTLRLGVTSYDLERLESFLKLSGEPVVPTVRAFLTRALDQALLAGKNLGGNVIMSWDPKSSDFIRWPPPEMIYPAPDG